jgi:hypothetical protein
MLFKLLSEHSNGLLPHRSDSTAAASAFQPEAAAARETHGVVIGQVSGVLDT